MRRLLLFVTVVAALIAAAVWLADRPGEVTIHWQGWRMDTTVPVLSLLLLAVLGVMHLVLRLVQAVIGGPRRWLAARRHKRTKAGYRALSDGLAAVAAGDSRQAAKLARRADKLLADPSLTGLLTARAAELSGDEAEARRRLDAMVVRPETAFLGLKGLLDLALKDGDREAALDYARRAWALQPGAEGLGATLFELQARSGQWAEAEATLAEARKRGTMSGAELARRRALVLDARAAAAGDAAEAMKLAVQAFEADSMLAPAAARAARLLHRAGKARKAASVIETAFACNPHPDLVAAWLDLGGDEAPLARVKRLQKLVKTNPEAGCGHLALAAAALDARLWGQARTHLDQSGDTGAEACRLWARLEREERRDEAAALAWTAKAAAAGPAAAWVCSTCGATTAAWSATCPACGEVDALDWRQPKV